MLSRASRLETQFDPGKRDFLLGRVWVGDKDFRASDR